MENKKQRVSENVGEKKTIKFIETFCGIGGFRLGLESVGREVQQSKQEEPKGQVRDQLSPRHDLGGVEGAVRESEKLFTCVWANEIDKYACQIYRRNLGDRELHEGDIHEVSAESIPDHELLVGGFPCQAFSIAGKRQGFADTRGTLFFEICRIAKAKRPKLLLLENVKGLLNHEGGQTFRTILSTLDELGYDAEWQVLNSKDFGVPQNRERVFIVGHSRRFSRGQVFPIQRTNSKTLKQLVPGSTGMRVYDKDQVSYTIASQAGGWGAKTGLYNTEPLVRRLTPTECCRLQGFPDNWVDGVSDSQKYKVLGNAVTVNVIQAIGEALKKMKETT